MSIERNKEIDYLRSYAILAVLSLHLILIFTPLTEANLVTNTGLNLRVGVDLFFVVSGYVVSNNYSLMLNNAKLNRLLYNQFLLQRFYRLWPAATFWLVICFLLSIFFSQFNITPTPEQTIKKLIYGLFYIFNFNEYNSPSIFGYFWSLSIEWQIYCLLPFLISWRSDLKLLFIIAVLLFLTYSRFGNSNWWMFRFDGILIGILLWHFNDKILTYKWILLNTSSIVRNLFIISIFILLVRIRSLIPNEYLSVSLESILGGFLVYLALQNKGIITTFGMKSVMYWLGLRSYSIYLVHIPVAILLLGIQKLYFLEIPVVLSICLCLLFTLLLADISYIFLEKKLRYWLTEYFRYV